MRRGVALVGLGLFPRCPIAGAALSLVYPSSRRGAGPSRDLPIQVVVEVGARRRLGRRDADPFGLFAEATGDHQWIHVDPEKAAAGPFGTTIAHGYLTLSLIPMLVGQIYRVDGLKMGINYGTNKVRLPSPVPVGSRVRAGAELLELKNGPQGAQATVRVTIEREGSDKPACVAETVAVLVP